MIPDNGLWCNGSTIDFESISLGSNPSRPVIERDELLKLDGPTLTIKAGGHALLKVGTEDLSPDESGWENAEKIIKALNNWVAHTKEINQIGGQNDTI